MSTGGRDRRPDTDTSTPFPHSCRMPVYPSRMLVMPCEVRPTTAGRRCRRARGRGVADVGQGGMDVTGYALDLARVEQLSTVACAWGRGEARELSRGDLICRLDLGHLPDRISHEFNESCFVALPVSQNVGMGVKCVEEWGKG